MVSAMEPTGRTQSRTLALLVLIVTVAFALRWAPAQRMLPQLPEPDAFQVLHAQEWKNDPALVRHWEYAQRYPQLLTRILSVFPVREPQAHLTGAERLDDALECAAAPYQRARIVVLLLSLLALPLTWLVARRFTGPNGALIATWLIATSLLHALFSTQGRPHGVHLTAALFAVWSALRLVERATVARTALAVIAAATAMATLQNGVFTLAPLALALWFTPGSRLRRAAAAVALPLVAAALAFTLYPVLPTIDSSGIHLGGALSHNVFFRDFTFRGVFVAARWFFGHDPIMCVLFLVGLAWSVPWLFKHGRELVSGRRALVAVVLAYVGPYSLLMLISEDVYERFLLPLLPWCAILALQPLTTFVEQRARTSRPSVAARLITAAIALVLMMPLAVAARFAWVSAQPDTLQQAADWLVREAGTEPIVVTPGLTLPLLSSPSALASGRGDSTFESRVWFAWQLAHPSESGGFDLFGIPGTVAGSRPGHEEIDAWLAARAPRYVVFEVSRKMTMLPALNYLREWSAARGAVVHRSDGPVPERIELGLADYQSIEQFAVRIFGMRAFGPEIEIWRIAR
ncbi:MAG: glycosyltransferase family 39 protein [Planctomycetes bacterium]|nr:glycosyltransferase family 39 protein [Planctomycetota bacterium]